MKKRFIPGFVVGISVGIVAALVALLRPGWVEGLELYTYDVRARASSNRGRADPRIVLVDVDDYDIRWVQRNSQLSWPWPREIFAMAAKHLLERGAAAVAFDFLFLDPGNSGVEDVELFGKVLGSSPSTIIGLELSKFARDREPAGPWAARIKTYRSCEKAKGLAQDFLWWQSRVFLIKREKGLGDCGGCEMWIGGEKSEKVLMKELQRLSSHEPFAELLGDVSRVHLSRLSDDVLSKELTEEQIAVERGALPGVLPEGSAYPDYPHIIPPLVPLMVNARLGVVRQEPDKDGLFRRYAPVMSHNEKLFPSFGVATALAAYPEKKLRATSEGLFYNGKRIPLDESGQAILRYHGSGNVYSRVGIRHILNVVARNMEIDMFVGSMSEAINSLNGSLDLTGGGDSEEVDLPERKRRWDGALDRLSQMDIFRDKCKKELGLLLKKMKSLQPLVKSDSINVNPQAMSSLKSLQKVLKDQGCRKKAEDTLVKYLKEADRVNPRSLEKMPGISAGQVKDRIFIIHAAAAAMRDLKPTPLDARALGAEINAVFLDNFLNGDFIIRIPAWGGAVLSFFLCCLLGVGAFLLVGLVRSSFLAAFSSLLVTAVLIGALALVEHLLFKGGGIWVDVAVPSLGALVTWAGVVGMHIYMESKDRRFIQDALGRYTSPALVQELMQNPKALSLEWGESRVLTVFFSDIVSFTSISERLGPQRLVILLNEYLTAMTDIILEEGGVVDKYIGDAIMAFWGAPVEKKDHAVGACRAALRTRLRLKELQKDWERRFKEMVRFRAGINSGDAVVGNMGSLHKYNYTVMGDTVNLAARLEGANKVYGTDLMIAQGTWALVCHEMVARELDFMIVKGKDEPVRVYELMGEKMKTNAAVEELVERFEKTLRIYRDRSFKEAKDQFEAILEDYPGDGPSELYVKRCEDYLRNPPAEDWDGVFRMTTK